MHDNVLSQAMPQLNLNGTSVQCDAWIRKHILYATDAADMKVGLYRAIDATDWLRTVWSQWRFSLVCILAPSVIMSNHMVLCWNSQMLWLLDRD